MCVSSVSASTKVLSQLDTNGVLISFFLRFTPVVPTHLNYTVNAEKTNNSKGMCDLDPSHTVILQ